MVRLLHCNHVILSGGFLQSTRGYTGLETPQPVPKGFDYRLWLGPAPEVPYTAARCHFNFRHSFFRSPNS